MLSTHYGAVVKTGDGRLVVAGQGDASMQGVTAGLRLDCSGNELRMRAIIRALTGVPDPAGETYINVEGGEGKTFDHFMKDLAAVATRAMANVTPQQPADLTAVCGDLTQQGYRVSGVQVAAGVLRTLPGEGGPGSVVYAVNSGHLEELMLGHQSLIPPSQ